MVTYCASCLSFRILCVSNNILYTIYIFWHSQWNLQWNCFRFSFFIYCVNFYNLTITFIDYMEYITRTPHYENTIYFCIKYANNRGPNLFIVASNSYHNHQLISKLITANKLNYFSFFIHCSYILFQYWN